MATKNNPPTDLADTAPSTPSTRPKRRRRRLPRGVVRVRCQSCNGSGKEALPNLDGVSMSQLARAAGRSRSLVSRMLSDNVADGQKRINPTLETMIAMCRAVEAVTGTPLGLNALAKAIRD